MKQASGGEQSTGTTTDREGDHVEEKRIGGQSTDTDERIKHFGDQKSRHGGRWWNGTESMTVDLTHDEHDNNYDGGGSNEWRMNGARTQVNESRRPNERSRNGRAKADAVAVKGATQVLSESGTDREKTPTMNEKQRAVNKLACGRRISMNELRRLIERIEGRRRLPAKSALLFGRPRKLVLGSDRWRQLDTGRKTKLDLEGRRRRAIRRRRRRMRQDDSDTGANDRIVESDVVGVG